MIARYQCYLCTLKSQCAALSQPVLMTYQHPVCQGLFWAVAYRNWNMEGIFSVSKIARGFVRGKFPIFAFLDLPFIELENLTIWARFPFWVQSGWRMSSNLYKVTNHEFIRKSCSGMVSIRLLSVDGYMFSCQCKGLSQGFKVREAFFIFLVSNGGKK